MIKLQSTIEYTTALPRNQYPDTTAQRCHLKGIEAAINYLTKKGKN